MKYTCMHDGCHVSFFIIIANFQLVTMLIIINTQSLLFNLAMNIALKDPGLKRVLD